MIFGMDGGAGGKDGTGIKAPDESVAEKVAGRDGGKGRRGNRKGFDMLQLKLECAGGGKGE
jgi:hypothetical protein